MNLTKEQQDAINDLASAVRHRYVEQVSWMGIPLAYKANGLEISKEIMLPYQEALNIANERVWKVLWNCFNLKLTQKHPGNVPKASFDPNKACDSRCWNATGWNCVCKCGSLFHSAGKEAVLEYYKLLEKEECDFNHLTSLV
jgi:hypothetical protein